MEEFLSKFRSTIEFQTLCDFEDYTADEITQIGLLGLKNQGCFVDVDYYSKKLNIYIIKSMIVVISLD